MDLGCSTHGRRRWPADAAILVLLAAGWIGFVGATTGWRRTVYIDTFRDMAWAENIRAGRIWADPALPGQTYWYAPGNPLLAAGVASVTGRPVVDVYGYAAFWCNAFIPLLLYVLVRSVWDRLTALVALPAVFLGSYWWLTHAVAPIPGIQGVALNVLGLLCWHRCVNATCDGLSVPARGRRRAWMWAGLTGLMLAASAWFHPLCAIVLAATIFLHAVTEAALPGLGSLAGAVARSRRFAPVVQMLWLAVVAAALAGPLIVHMLALRVHGSALLRFFPHELVQPVFYAHAQTPLVVPAALVGIWWIVRRTPRAVWIIAYLLVGQSGQALGYLGQASQGYVPCLLPHEFQWHGQLAVGVCAAVGIAALARVAVAWLRPWRRTGLAVAAWTVVLTAVSVGPGVLRLPDAGVDLVELEPLLARTRELRAWIRENTSLDATFVCPPETAYMVVSGLTGRKCVVGSPGHTNPAVDAKRRYDDVKTMLETTDPHALARLADEYGATHLLLPFDSASAAEETMKRYAAWPRLERVFVSSERTWVVYRIRPPVPADSDALP